MDIEYGECIKVISSSDSSHGGFRASGISSGKGKHVSAVFAASASGIVLIPFFVVAEKYVMTPWTKLLGRGSTSGLAA